MPGRTTATITAYLVAGLVLAQNEEDALRISTGQPGGTARSNGMANAFGALGADPVSISINPAGLALYRTSGL
ncbi:MAG: aromatic hydrocarbon degradation protein, partial [Flavobacteriales bacterium]|nr:aromatic hydrocarbon degradation protein [Flavobacteriales bacterium]